MSDQPPTPPSQPGGPPPQPYQPGPPQGARPGGTNGLAVASLILGILWICWLGSILAVIFGHVALAQIKKSGNLQQGRGLAIAGLVLGYIALALLVMSMIFGNFTFEVGLFETF